MADVVSSFLNVLFLGLLIIIPLFGVIFFRDRLSFWPGRRIIQIDVYNLMDGIVMPEDGCIQEDMLEIVRNWKAWEIKKKGVKWFWVEIGFLRGFQLDYKAKVSIRKFGGEPTVRLLEYKPKIYESDNFIPLDLPEKIPHSKYVGDLSAAGESMYTSVGLQLSRVNKRNLWIDVGLPMAALVFCMMMVILTNGYLSDQSKQASNAYIATINSAADRMVVACGGEVVPYGQNETEKQEESGSFGIPLVSK